MREDAVGPRAVSRSFGLALAFILAASTTIMTTWFVHIVATDDPSYSDTSAWWIPIAVFATAAAWVAGWAWFRRRWGLAAACFPLTLVAPWGYWVELSGPLAIGFTIASVCALIKARRTRGARAFDSGSN